MNEPGCIDPAVLAALEADVVTAARPFPWCELQRLIRDAAYSQLLEELPQLEKIGRAHV